MKKIALEITLKRESKPIETTLELVDIIKSAVPEKYKKSHHPARKVFQAIRIEVNNELEVFELALKDSLSLLKPKGRICVITFHSLEDKICKRIFKEASQVDHALKNLPVIPKEFEKGFKIIKQIKPSSDEVEGNNRARSSKLRVIEKEKG